MRKMRGGGFLFGELPSWETQIRGEHSQAGNQKSKMLQNPKPCEHQVDSESWDLGFSDGGAWLVMSVHTYHPETLLGTSALDKGCAGSVCPVLGVVGLEMAPQAPDRLERL